MATRRGFLKSGAAIAALLPFAARAQAPAADAAFYAQLDRLKDSTDGAAVGTRALGAVSTRRLTALRAFDPAPLSPDARLDYDGILEGLQLEDEICRGFPFGVAGAFVSPYAVSPRAGTHLAVAGIAKNAPPQILAGLVRDIDDETRRITAEGAQGIVPPDVIRTATLAKLAAARDAAPPGPLPAALRAQIAALTAVRRQARPDAGVWSLPGGDDYYALALKIGTSLDVTPEAAHARGLEQVRTLGLYAEVLLRAQSLTQGSVGARLHALAQDPRYLYSDDDAGRAKAVADMNARLARVRPLLGKVFRGLSTGPIDVALAGPGLIGYRKAPSYDGRTPGAYYVDLRNILRRPDWALPTVVHHETLPGHLLQLPLQEHAAPPPLRLRYTPNAFFEGWAIYAEQLAEDLGLFEGDDRARLGFLQSLLVRAGRLVVDTGIHFKRWTRAEAVARFFDIAGDAPDTFENEVDRIIVQPGLTSGPALGYATIMALRARVEARSASPDELREAVFRPRGGFDPIAFHDAVLKRGALRLSLLDRVIPPQ